ncbi:hypothetical protein Goshw_029001 [Gossypium schwendimanii]|uniref:Uncharacterized protein n=1 Tax=Gossypium schwendimanii TaxID=34291 RepID=A0A7J9M8G8_GOSSC|nr:hypothetical protein [Gossypium schwendimanii]
MHMVSVTGTLTNINLSTSSHISRSNQFSSSIQNLEKFDPSPGVEGE